MRNPLFHLECDLSNARIELATTMADLLSLLDDAEYTIETVADRKVPPSEAMLNADRYLEREDIEEIKGRARKYTKTFGA